MVSIGAVPGNEHVIERENVYDDVAQLYKEGSIMKEFPLKIKFAEEKGVDLGGVSRDMFSSFWEEAYKKVFDGVSTLIPLLHPQTQIRSFEILGKVISHGYLVSGHLPIQISLPTLLTVLLGSQVEIPCKVLLDAFRDYINPQERKYLREALSGEYFDVSSMINSFTRFGCRQVPTVSNLCSILVDVARFELIQKTAAAIATMNYGVPDDHKVFWQGLGVGGITQLYQTMFVSRDKILNILVCECINPAEERVFGYLQSFIANLKLEDLVNFVRFCTGSSVLTPPNYK